MSDSQKPIHILLESLPESSMTTRLLKLLDPLVPGQWQNITNFTAMVKAVTEEEDEALIQQVGERAIKLYNDPANGYQRAVWLYQLVDDTSGLVGLSAFGNKLSGSFDFLSFLGKVTPKADTVQAVDAALKLVAELVAFNLVNGIPGDNVMDFAKSLANVEHEDAMRLAAFLAYDCVLPLGPDFLNKLTGSLSNVTDDLLGGNSRFSKIAQYLPVPDLGGAKALIVKSLESTGDVLGRFTASKGLTQGSVLESVRSLLGNADHKLDYVAAGIDWVSNHFEHTGIQSVTRRVISRAYGEI